MNKSTRLQSTHFRDGAGMKFHIITENQPDGTSIARVNGLDLVGKGDRAELATQDLKAQLEKAVRTGTL